MIQDKCLEKSIYDIPIDSDCVAHLLVKTWKLTPWKLGILSAVVTILLVAITLFVELVNHTIDIAKISESQARDYWFPLVIWGLLINPIVYYYYLWTFTAIIRVIERLQEFQVLPDLINDNDGVFIKKLYTDFYIRNRWRELIKLFALFVAVIVSIVVLQLYFPGERPSAVPLPRPLIALSALVITYFGFMVVLNLIANIRILFSLFNQEKIKLKLNPLHPDRCGGLSPLSEYSLKTAYLAAPLGLWVGILEYKIFSRHELPEYFHFVLILYICISLAVFFGPLAAAHDKMKNAKNEQLHKIADQYLDDYPSVYDHLQADLSVLSKKISKLQTLRRFYSITDEFPVWPFDVKKIRSYLLSASTPLIPTVFNLLKNIIGILLAKLSAHGS